MAHLMFETDWESKSTDSHVAEKIVIVLVLDGALDKDCVPDTTQEGQLKCQSKPKFIILKGLISKVKLRSSL